MKKFITFFTLIACTILTSCVESLYPITDDENDLVFKKELLGTWIDHESVEYIIEQGNAKAYRATIVESKKTSGSGNFSDTSCLVFSLVNVKGALFLDCVADMEKFQNKAFGEAAVSSVLPTHVIIPVISIGQNTVQLAPMDHDELFAVLHQGKIEIKSEVLNKDDLLFTEKPKNLQQKLIELKKFPAIVTTSVLARATNRGR